MTASSDIRPFRIAVEDCELEDLRRRLAATRWPEAETVDDWSQGVPLAYAQDLAAYWAEGYDWRACEARLNRFDQFLTGIDGLDIHFLHRRSPETDAFPLLITHGWPGSVAEFQAIVDPLADPAAHGGRAADAFHVVCPSLPGYGFSGKPDRTGWGVEKIALAWDALMARLGYDRYGAQGGDWGAAVTTALGRRGGGCIAIHTNMPLGRPDEGAKTAPGAADTAAFAAAKQFRDRESGYATQQATRPQTLGYGLVDSPAGQLAWIVEKFWAWTDCERDGVRHPENAIDRDVMLDNVMLYWLTRSGASSARLYWESFRQMAGSGRVAVPTGIAAFPKEILCRPRNWCEALYTITHWTDMKAGGHFAALEQPEALVADIRTFFATVR